MKLHYGTLSSSSRRVLITAKRLGIELELNALDLRNAHDRQALAKLNPNNKVPVFIDGDFVLWESIAIMQYLCDRTAGQTLYPSERRARAEINRWLSWAQAHWAPAIGAISWENVWKRLALGAGPDPDQLKRQESFFTQFAAVLDGQLAGRTWLAGEALSLADIAVGTPLMMTALARLPLQPYANIRSWFARVQALPEWQATEPAQLAMLEAQFLGPAATEKLAATSPRPEA